jgi:hypothetical protein
MSKAKKLKFRTKKKNAWISNIYLKKKKENNILSDDLEKKGNLALLKKPNFTGKNSLAFS